MTIWICLLVCIVYTIMDFIFLISYYHSILQLPLPLYPIPSLRCTYTCWYRGLMCMMYFHNILHDSYTFLLEFTFVAELGVLNSTLYSPCNALWGNILTRTETTNACLLKTLNKMSPIDVQVTKYILFLFSRPQTFYGIYVTTDISQITEIIRGRSRIWAHMWQTVP